MANQQLFSSASRGVRTPAADTLNSEFSPAYAFTAERALAQFACTGCLNGTFYASAQDQLSTVLDLAKKVDPEFLAKTALYARQTGHMKDMPALLLAVLSTKSPELLRRTFPTVIDNGKMVRNFVQIMRSGQVGRKSLGNAPRNLVREWFDRQSDDAVFRSAIGNKPSLQDVIKLIRPRPASPSRDALYGYLLDREYNFEALPQLVKSYEDFKAGRSNTPPKVPFQKLDSLGLKKEHWQEIARNAPWQMTRMNLNTFHRQGVFEDSSLVTMLAERLRDPQLVKESKVFPYQLLAAYKNANVEVPFEIREALQDAMEIAIQNVPEIEGKIVICPDVSGSMSCPVTGYREGSSSAVQCVDVAALTAAAFMRKNSSARVIPFSTGVDSIELNPRDSVVSNSQKLASICGGGTNCSAPLRLLNQQGAKADLLVYVSDNESWLDHKGQNRGYYWGGTEPTAMMEEWNAFKSRNPSSKLVCIDITPNETEQVIQREDILSIGGFSDAVFSAIRDFAIGSENGSWTDLIERVEVPRID